MVIHIIISNGNTHKYAYALPYALPYWSHSQYGLPYAMAYGIPYVLPIESMGSAQYL